MSEKFRSASNESGNTQSAGSLKEKLGGQSAPDAGVNGDLDIQDLLKKYLPEFAEEEKTMFFTPWSRMASQRRTVEKRLLS